MLRHYESVCLVRPNVPEADVEKFMERVAGLVTSQGGRVLKTDRKGIVKLSYRVEKQRDALVLMWEFESGPQVPVEVERAYRLSEHVIRFMIAHKVKEPTPRAPAASARVEEGAKTDASAPAGTAAASTPS